MSDDLSELLQTQERHVGIGVSVTTPAPAGTALGPGQGEDEWEEVLVEREGQRPFRPTQDIRRALASMEVAGVPRADMAQEFHVDPSQISSALRQSAMEPFLEGARAKANRRKEFGLLRLESNLDRALQNIGRVLENEAHRDNTRLSMWVVEKGLREQLDPKVVDGSIQIQMAMSERVTQLVEDAAMGFARSARHIPRGEVGAIGHLVQGKDVARGVKTREEEDEPPDEELPAEETPTEPQGPVAGEFFSDA